MLYQPHIQQLYNYVSIRVKKDIENLNKERKADGLPELKPTDEQLAEINQNVLNMNDRTAHSSYLRSR